VNLQELIARLEKLPKDQAVRYGFARPHSYRGYYNQLAFEPEENTTVGAMLDAANSANGETYEGWKGGEYYMHGDTAVWLANRGEGGEELGHMLLDFILGVK